MFNIRDFLKKASGRQTKELFFRQTVQEVIKANLGVELPIEAISLRSSTIYLKNISQAARSVIFIKKTQILDQLNKKQDFYKINDLR